MTSPVLSVYLDHEDDFYKIMGPYFATREFVTEMGGWQFFTKPNATWFVLLSADGKEVLGFCSLFHEKNTDYLDNLFILPKHRGKKYSKLLMKTVLKFSKRDLSCITDNPIMATEFTKYGFEPTGNRGKFLKFLRKIQ
jgi:GNAT superfamily N-acetyltransferase